MNDIRFLSFEDIELIHEDQLKRYAGASGMVDENVIRSIVGAPMQTMSGPYLHDDIIHMAAAYLFGFATTQGFRDGNKRTAVVACDVFLELNGYELDCSNEELYKITMLAANHHMDRDAVTSWMRERVSPVDPRQPAASFRL